MSLDRWYPTTEDPERFWRPSVSFEPEVMGALAGGGRLAKTSEARAVESSVRLRKILSTQSAKPTASIHKCCKMIEVASRIWEIQSWKRVVCQMRCCSLPWLRAPPDQLSSSICSVPGFTLSRFIFSTFMVPITSGINYHLNGAKPSTRRQRKANLLIAVNFLRWCWVAEKRGNTPRA